MYLLARESLGSEIDVNHVVRDKPRESLQNDRCGEIKNEVNEVHTEHTTNSDITETKFKRPRALSDLLPPIFLPPIHQRCMAKLLQRGKVQSASEQELETIQVARELELTRQQWAHGLMI